MLRQRIKSESGFTLVELAIVMIIIGLLIGGVLKGQQLITNAQVTATIAQIKALDAAATSFKDAYNDIPGDMTSPQTRLPNCTTAPCDNPGNGNQHLEGTPGTLPSAANEGEAYFVQLAAASLITGIVPGTDTFGGNYPQTKISGSGIYAANSTGLVADFAGLISTTVTPSSGTYLTIMNDISAAPSATSGTGLRPSEAFRIDTKIDDGAPDTGTVRAFGGATCAAAATGYATKNTSAACGLYAQIQN